MKDFCCWLMSPQQLLPPSVFHGAAVPEAYWEKITQKEKNSVLTGESPLGSNTSLTSEAEMGPLHKAGE